MPLPAMSCSAPLPDAPRWCCCATTWGLGTREQLRPGDGCPTGRPQGPLSDTLKALSRVPCSEGAHSLLFPFKTRPEEEARSRAALFVTLQAYKSAPTTEEDSPEGPRAEGFKEAVEK